MPCLNVKESKKFLRDVVEGLKHPSYPIPTPRVDKAIEKLMVGAKKKNEDKRLAGSTHKG